MTNNKLIGKALILSCHFDDEVLMCGGILKHLNSGVIFYSNTNQHPGLDYDGNTQYLNEFKVLVSLLKKYNVDYALSEYRGHLGEMHMLSQMKLLNEIQSQINIHKPDSVFIPFFSYNQDHKILYDIALAALRPHDKNHYVKNIFICEQPETIHTMSAHRHAFSPNTFVPIDIEEKIELIKIYETQLRGHRDLDAIKALAKLRGSQCNAEYAEAFYAVRTTL